MAGDAGTSHRDSRGLGTVGSMGAARPVGVVTLIALDFVVIAPLRGRFRHGNLQLGRIDPATRTPQPLAVGFVSAILARVHPKSRSRRSFRRLRGET